MRGFALRNARPCTRLVAPPFLRPLSEGAPRRGDRGVHSLMVPGLSLRTLATRTTPALVARPPLLASEIEFWPTRGVAYCGVGRCVKAGLLRAWALVRFGYP